MNVSSVRVNPIADMDIEWNKAMAEDLNKFYTEGDEIISGCVSYKSVDVSIAFSPIVIMFLYIILQERK